jgi:hypothetical protein
MHRIQQGPGGEDRQEPFHLDLISDTFDGETERLLSLGAHRLRDQQSGKSRWTTFADIEGNEFDVRQWQRHRGPRR